MNNEILEMDVRERTAIEVTKKDLYCIVKRTFDIICALIGCVMLLPIILVVKVIYVFSKEEGKVIYTQNRIGKDGKIFKIYKLRTMTVDADRTLELLLKTSPDLRKEYKINKKLENDPRITKVGKILRKTSLDELPQVINVLKGDMSMIGPRPYLEREIKDMGKYYNYVIESKPGLTGLWQVSGRSNTTFKERCKIDKEYAKEKSLKMDIKIFFKTFSAVLCKKGAK